MIDGKPTLDDVNPINIVSIRQNNPELIVQDCVNEFGLNGEQADRLRLILLARGVNKWLFARRKFIKLKHEVKELFRASIVGSDEHKFLSWLNQRMQNIAKIPRWVEWPKTTTHNFKNVENKIVIKGRHM